MSQLNIRDLYSTINQKTIKRMEIYDQTLQKCHKRIKYNADLQRTYCFFQIPEFIIGVPLYNPQEMKSYIINSLKSNGFKLIYVEPNWLFISWDDPASKVLIKNGSKSLQKESKSSKKNQGEYKSIQSFQPKGSFIYDQSSLLGLGNKLS